MKILYLKTCASTMDFACGLAQKGSPAWTAVVSQRQSSGRGRFRRRWLSPRGGIYSSVVLRPVMKLSMVPLLGLLASAAIAEFIKKEFNISASTKWPNDVLVAGKKISGILLETGVSGGRLDWIIMGLGLNLNASAGLPEACSVSGLTGKTYDTKIISKKMLIYVNLIFERFSRSPQKTIRRWIKYSSTPLRRVTINNPGCRTSGVAVGLDLSGALVIKKESGILQRVYAGDCTYQK